MFGKNRFQTILIRLVVLSGAAFWFYVAFSGKGVTDAALDITKFLIDLFR